MSHALRSVVGASLLAAGTLASAQTVVPEREPNETKAAADLQLPLVLASGDAITGVTTGTATTEGTTNSLDYHLVQTSAAPLGVYRHRLVLTTTGAAGHTVALRGRSQSAGVVSASSDVDILLGQTSSVPPRQLQWYGFGKGEKVYVRVSGTVSTTGPYLLSLETAPVAVQDLGVFAAGDITITTVGQNHTSDTALWVYDDELDSIPGFGNDDEPSPGTTARSRLTRTFAPGVYHLVVTVGDSFLSQRFAVDQAAPADDRKRNNNVTDFEDLAVNGSQSSLANVGFSIEDAHGPVPVGSYKFGRYTINWFRFTVGTPATGACCQDSGSCVPTTVQRCGALRGLYQGDGQACGAPACPAPGGCCAHGSCAVVSLRGCQLAGGDFDGAAACGGACAPGAGTLTGIPAQSSTLVGGLTRGFWFTAPADFRITGLRAPDPSGLGSQHVEVVRLAAAPPTDLAGTHELTTLLRRTFVPSPLIVECDVAVSAGDIVGVLGACGDEASITTSLGAANPVTSIQGHTVTLRRLQMQHNIAITAALGLATAGTEIGRVEMYTAAPGVPASGACCTGTGCAVVAGAGMCPGGSFYQGDDSACGPAGNPTTCCPANHNLVNGVDLLDIFAFLNHWFGGNILADFNHMNGVDLLDIFAFLNAWFRGC